MQRHSIFSFIIVAIAPLVGTAAPKYTSVAGLNAPDITAGVGRIENYDVAERTFKPSRAAAPAPARAQTSRSHP